MIFFTGLQIINITITVLPPKQSTTPLPPPVTGSLIGTGCGVGGVGVEGGGWVCSPISLPIRRPDKAIRTEAREEEVSGFTVALLPVERGPMWQGVICPSWTRVLSPQSPTQSLPETGSPFLRVTSCKSMTSLFLPLKRISMEQRPGAAHEGGVHYSVCVCVCLALPPRPLV